MIRRILSVLALGLTLTAQAQTFPSKPVRIITPFPVGSGPEGVARLVADKLSKTWGQPVTVENRPGGNGFIAIDAFKRGATDGSDLIQLDNVHLLAASEEARADRAEAELAATRSNVADQKRCWTNHSHVQRKALNAARARIVELEAQIEDWRLQSGELAAEQPAADPPPDLTDAGEAPIPLVLTASAREADFQRDRADALAASLRAAEVELVETRAARDHAARAAGAHLKTIEELRTRLDLALSAIHRPAPVEQIPGVAAAPRLLRRLECTICPYVAREIDEEAGDKCPRCGSKLAEVEPCDACGKPVRDGERTGEAETASLCSSCHRQARAEEARVTAATDDPPETKESSQ